MNNLEASSNNLLKLDQYDLIAVSGEDAQDFLNNQFTNDLKNLAKDTCSIAAWCSVKGRVLYNFRMWHTSDGFILLLPNEQTESFLKKLKMFVFRSKVSIELLENRFCYGLYGNTAEEMLSIEPSLNNNQLLLQGELTIIKLPADIPRYLLISPKNDLHTILNINQTKQVDEWQRFDLAAGIVEIQPSTADLFLPQMLNFEQLGALSFQKGCYPGQEIVARVKYRGEVKQQLYSAEITFGNTLSPGMPIGIGESQKLIGHVVNCTKSDANNLWKTIIVINIKNADSTELSLQEYPSTDSIIQNISSF